MAGKARLSTRARSLAFPSPGLTPDLHPCVIAADPLRAWFRGRPAAVWSHRSPHVLPMAPVLVCSALMGIVRRHSQLQAHQVALVLRHLRRLALFAVAMFGFFDWQAWLNRNR